MPEIVPIEDRQKFVIQWSACNLLGWVIGFGFFFLIATYLDTRNMEPAWAMMLTSLPFGASVGTLQGFQFRKFRVNIFKWTILTALGWSLGLGIGAMFIFGDYYPSWVSDLYLPPFNLSDRAMDIVPNVLIPTMAITGAIISGTIIGGFQFIIIRKVISRPILWIRAHIFGLLLPTISACFIYFAKSWLKKTLFSFRFLPGSFLSTILFNRWTLVYWFCIMIAILSLSLLTGKVLSKQSNMVELVTKTTLQASYKSNSIQPVAQNLDWVSLLAWLILPALLLAVFLDWF